ncbi:low molecular weight phosphatase family protein [Microbacterium sp. NPDC056003]|jgi:protein-tyrosine phosphatase|uniref:arsenate-mycothiol transferase ArsC n=1 Tax=Microbacterium sp. NPDC056003 TaxID=3345676 RepID=UPI0035DC2ED1
MARSRSLSLPVRSPDPEHGVTHVLFVCQANRCRSPYAAEIMRLLADDSLDIHSGGLMAGGHRMPPAGVQTGAHLGIDFSSHRSRELDRGDLGGFDVILTMARAQSRELAADDAHVTHRIFTVKQFARWLTDHPLPAGMPLGKWLDEAAHDRPRDDFLGDDESDDVADPIASPPSAWVAMVRELTAVLSTIVAALGAARD